MPEQSIFQLNVHQVDQQCLFELSWSQGRRLTALLSYPQSLIELYQQWRQFYLSFYRTVQIPLVLSPHVENGLRGRRAESGSIISTPKDWQAKLVEVEAKFLYAFHHWLRSAELYEIRAKLAEASRLNRDGQPVDLFLTCTPIQLSRLPWETWEIGTEFASMGGIRIARSPANIRVEANPRNSLPRRRTRILAILGDDTGLNFKVDRDAVQSLSRFADIEFVGWQPGKSIDELKTEITQAIAHPLGWDILFFAGHSNETTMTGGELAIAPQTHIALRDIAPQLAIAKERGLQFAIFNSCNGINIAETLIDLGLSQVAVMREPIHNRVAQEFLIRFLQSLADHKDVHESLITASQFLKTTKNLTYPSAYLAPSLFRHPDSTLFRVQPIGWKQQFRRLMPKRYEAIALAVLMILGSYGSVQYRLLEGRVLAQARYRQWTHRVQSDKPSPLLLVRVDGESLDRENILERNPIPPDYLASLITQLSARDVSVIGIDYLIDRQQEGSDLMAKAVREVAGQGTIFVFASIQDNHARWMKTTPEIADPVYSIHGDAARAWGNDYRMPLLIEGREHLLPFALLMVLLQQNSGTSSISNEPVGLAIFDNPGQLTELFSPRLYWQSISRLSYRFKQYWLHPITDFSLPPHQVYQSIPAWKLLEQPNAPELKHLPQQAVMIAAGGYEEAGLIPGDDNENFEAPDAMSYWYRQENPHNPYREMTGGEQHAYLFHHFLNRRFVIPVPNLWMILLAAIAGKVTVLLLARQRSTNTKAYQRYEGLIGSGLLISTAIYALMSLELYVSTLAIAFPIVLPIAAYWGYVLPSLFRNKP
ncbi:MAG: CHASE2 domain-containing protein [Elainellaceae cyanobacterium]